MDYWEVTFICSAVDADGDDPDAPSPVKLHIERCARDANALDREWEFTRLDPSVFTAWIAALDVDRFAALVLDYEWTNPERVTLVIVSQFSDTTRVFRPVAPDVTKQDLFEGVYSAIAACGGSQDKYDDVEKALRAFLQRLARPAETAPQPSTTPSDAALLALAKKVWERDVRLERHGVVSTDEHGEEFDLFYLAGHQSGDRMRRALHAALVVLAEDAKP